MSAAHTPAVDNYEADQLSRNLNPNREWSVTDEEFSQMLKAFPFQPTIDLFASRVKANLPNYASWKPDPFARYVDAFTVNWALHPFLRISPVYSRESQKIRGDGATGLLIIPMWPTQSYFGSFNVGRPATLLQDNQDNADESFSAVGELTYLLRVTILVCRVSGNPLSSAGLGLV